MISTRPALFALLFPLLLAQPVASIQPVYATRLAIDGYDPVAYFTEAKPIRGNTRFEFKWKGAKWFFSNAENLQLFTADPEKYAPKYGGYCAYAVSQGNTARIDPKAWKVVGSSLYLNFSLKI
jgi:YHS domain-containing protein